MSRSPYVATEQLSQVPFDINDIFNNYSACYPLQEALDTYTPSSLGTAHLTRIALRHKAFS